MKPFSRLLDALSYQPQRNLKIRLLADYFAHTPDPDRGYGLAALTGVLDFAHAKPALLRGLVAERVDPELFGWSYDYVGDLAETISLIWPGGKADTPSHSLGATSVRLSDACRIGAALAQNAQPSAGVCALKVPLCAGRA